MILLSWLVYQARISAVMPPLFYVDQEWKQKLNGEYQIRIWNNKNKLSS
jgi:hypothetical protein